MPARRRAWEMLVVASAILAVVAACAAATCETCAAADRWTESPPFEESRLLFNEFTLGLDVGAEAPMLSDLGVVGQRAVLAIQVGTPADEAVALRLVAESVDLRVIFVLAQAASSDVARVRSLLGDGVDVVTDPLASIVQVSYLVGDFVGSGGATFLLDEEGRILLRRLGPPIWLFYDDLAAGRAFAEGRDVAETALPQFVLSAGEEAPIPPFTLLDQDGAEVRFADGTPRLLYCGPAPSTEVGALILSDLDSLRREFPDVEFVWCWGHKSRDHLAQMWRLFNAAEIAGLHPEWYELPFDEYMEAIDASLEATAITAASDVDPAIPTGWRHVFDPGSQLATFWCLRYSPCILILDGARVVAFPFATYPTNASTGELRVHPGAREALRQILREIGGP